MRTCAVLGFLAYFAGWSFGVVDIERGDVFESRILHWGTFVVAPCFLIGLAVARWTALTLPLVFPLLHLLPERCVVARSGDVVTTTCYPGAWVDVPVEIAMTLPFIAAGVLVSRAARRRHVGGRRRRGVALAGRT